MSTVKGITPTKLLFQAVQIFHKIYYHSSGNVFVLLYCFILFVFGNLHCHIALRRIF